MAVKPVKSKAASTAKITAAHLAGLRPLPPPGPGVGPADPSTALVGGFALTVLLFPELPAVLGFGNLAGAPHSAAGLFVLLAVIAVFGILPILLLQHLFLQSGPLRASPAKRWASALLALAAIGFATDAMKPIVGFQQKLSADRQYAERATLAPGTVGRAPASALVESVRQGTSLFQD